VPVTAVRIISDISDISVNDSMMNADVKFDPTKYVAIHRNLFKEVMYEGGSSGSSSASDGYASIIPQSYDNNEQSDDSEESYGSQDETESEEIEDSKDEFESDASELPDGLNSLRGETRGDMGNFQNDDNTSSAIEAELGAFVP
jgi:hypothetical protein